MKGFRTLLMFSFLIWVCTNHLYAQYENVWMFGRDAGFDFNGTTPTAVSSNFATLAGSRTIYGEANASVCNDNGELLFYTEGTMVIDRQHSLMGNGDSLISHLVDLSGASSTSSTAQGTIIIPVPGKPEKYYVFSLTSNPCEEMQGRLYYSLIDMGANGGLGAVVPGQKGILLDTGLTERMTAVAGDGYRVWLLVVSRVSNEIKAFEVSTCGVNSTPVRSGPFTDFLVWPGSPLESGCLAVSPSRSLVAISGMGNPDSTMRNGLFLLDFDTLTGQLSNPKRLSSSGRYGVCFSPDNTKLYAGVFNSSVLQYDLSTGSLEDIRRSETALFDSLVYPGQIKIAPNGKIYFWSGRTSFAWNAGPSLGVINSPNLPGRSCLPERNGLRLDDQSSYLGLPNAIVPRRDDLGIVLTNDSGCAPFTVGYGIVDAHVAEHYTWDFGDGSPVNHQPNPSHTYDMPGVYNVTLYLAYKNRPCVDTFNKAITVFKVFQPQIMVRDTLICNATDSVTVGVHVGNSNANTAISWGPAPGILGTSYDSVISVNPNINSVYYVRVTDSIPGVCGISTIDTVHIDLAPRALDIQTNDTLICEGSEVQISVTGTPRYSYQWTPAEGVFSPTDQNPILRPGRSTRYTVVASYPGCMDTAQSIYIEVEEVAGPSFTMDPDSVCVGERVSFFSQLDNVASSVGQHWIFGDGTEKSVPNAFLLQHAYDQPGAFPVTMTGHFKACPDSAFVDSIHVYALPEVDLGIDSSICLHGAPVYLKNLSTAPLTPYHQVWNTGDTTAVLKVVHPGIYTLSVTTDPIGCTTTESIEITKDCYIDIPNAFTPNGDGNNDYFLPRLLLSESLTRFRMQVFNRWGQVVFETTRLDGRGWDGRFNDKAQPMGVYLYRIEADFHNDRQERYEGNVTLIR